MGPADRSAIYSLSRAETDAVETQAGEDPNREVFLVRRLHPPCLSPVVPGMPPVQRGIARPER